MFINYELLINNKEQLKINGRTIEVGDALHENIVLRKYYKLY